MLSLVPIPHDPLAAKPPTEVAAFLEAAERRVEAFRAAREDERIQGFVGSNGWIAWHALRRIRDEGLAPGGTFVEWGSGFGIVTGLAALAGFSARGIEIEPFLVARSRELLSEHGIEAVIEEGTYVPPGAFTDDVTISSFAPAEGDVVYAYPWPAEEGLIESAFLRFGRKDALLVTFGGGTDLRIQRRID